MALGATTNNFLCKFPLFKELDEAQLYNLSERVQCRNFPRNAVVITEGEYSNSLYLIISGKVKVYVTDADGREVILNFQSSGEYFGEIALLDEQPRSASVKTVQASRLGMISKADFTDFLNLYPELAMKIMQQFTKRLRSMTDDIKSLALLDVYNRVTRALTNLSRCQNGRQVVTERLTHQDLANIVGASREMVTKIMKGLNTGGYIKIENHTIVIQKKFPQGW